MGFTSDPGFPVTPGVFQTVCSCTSDHFDYFVLKLNPDGSKPVYSTFLGEKRFNVQEPTTITLDAQGIAHLVTRSSPITAQVAEPSIRIRMLSSTGSRVVFDRSLIMKTAVFDFVADGLDNLILSGAATAIDAPPDVGAFQDGRSFAAIVRVSDGAVLYSARLPFVLTAAAPDHKGGFIVLGGLANAQTVDDGAWSQVRFVPDAVSRPAVLAISNSAQSFLESSIAPGEIVNIYWTNLGPRPTQKAEFDAQGHLPFTLGGTRVEIGGVPAALLTVGDQEVTVVVPFSTPSDDSVGVQVTANGQPSNTAVLFRTAAEPQILAPALNQDGTLNSADHPAGGGEILTAFINGAGALSPTSEEGAAGNAGQTIVLPVAAVASRLGHSPQYNFSGPAEVVYAGAAPGLVGVTQLNLKLPQGPTSPTLPAALMVTIGDQSTYAGFWMRR